MLKKTISILLSLCMLITVFAVTLLTVNARDVQSTATGMKMDDGDYICGDFSYNLNDDGTAVLYSYKGSADKIDFPSSVDGHTVTEIGNFILAWYEPLTSVTIPETVTKIGGAAFLRCTNLTTVNITDSVIDYGEDAFAETPWFDSWYDSQPNGVLYLNNCLYGIKGSCPEEVEVRDGTVVICGEAFKSCEKLKKITFPNTLKAIGDGAFSYCRGLIEINMPDSVTEIGSGAFNECNFLKSVRLPKALKEINDNTFEQCTSLTGLEIPDTVTKIGNWAFDSAFSVYASNITLPDSVTQIGSHAFKNCKWLVRVEIPESVNVIGFSAFENCKNLDYVKISGNKATIGDRAFYGCPELASVDILEGISKIGDYSFCNCTKLKSITIPSSVKTIEEYALGYQTSGSLISGFTIYGYTNSEAERYANDNSITFISLGNAPPVQTQLLGDADGNGTVESVDMTLIQRKLAQLALPEGFNDNAADVDCSGAIEIIDATYIQRYLAHLDVPYPIGENM